jgi:hypothetical protein
VEHREKIEFCNMIADFQRWSQNLHNAFRKIKLPKECMQLTDEQVRDILQEFPGHESPQKLQDRLETWMQRYFS